MSFIVEATVIASIASAAASVVSAVLAKRRAIAHRHTEVHFQRIEEELHAALREMRDRDSAESETVRKNIEQLVKQIEETEKLIREEHNRQIQPTVKARG